MASFKERGKQIVGTVAQSTDRQWVVWLTASVPLVVSLLSCVTYIALMSNAFPDGMFRIACYVGAGANFLLMVALLWGKFVWIRPGTHQSKFSWVVMFIEMAIAALNLMLAYALSHGGPSALQFPLNFWYSLAPMSPVFSMVGAILLLMSSNDMKLLHKTLEAHEEMRESEQELALQQHRANMTIQSTYVDYIEAAMIKRLNSQAVLETIDRNADATVARVIANMSGMSPVAIPERKTGTSVRQQDPITDPAIRLGQTADVRSILAAMSVPPDHEDEVLEQLVKKGVIPVQEPPLPLV